MKQPIVYVPMTADILHPGHIRLLQKAAELGEVVVGLGTDERITFHKGREPAMSYEDRREVVEAIRYVSRVIKKDATYRENLKELQPQFVVHGDDWDDDARQQVLTAIAEWGGELIEYDYNAYPGSSTAIKQKIRDQR